MFDNILTSIGVGSLKINTLIESKSVSSQGNMRGLINFISGESHQTIKKVELTLIERYENPDEKSDFPTLENELQTFTLPNEINLLKHENKQEQFEFNISKLEFKSNPKKLILKTHVFIAHSIDEYDEDEIQLKN